MRERRTGTNASGMRRYNERLILSAVRRMGGASKAELARVTSLSPQAVVRIVDELEAEGFLVQAGRRMGGIGQPATLYRIHGERGSTIGVEVGRGGLTLVQLGFDGACKAVHAEPCAFPSIDKVLASIADFIARHVTGDLLGVGIAMPWFPGEWRQETGASDEQAGQWRAADVEARLREGIAWPTFFANDGNAAALAQSLCGAGADLQDFLVIHLGSFVGGGLVLGGRVVEGRHGNAGALASMPVHADGHSDYLVHHASLYALDPQARSEWAARCGDALGFAVIGANSLLDLEAVIIDGPLPRDLLAEVMARLEQRLTTDTPPDFFRPALRQGALGEVAVATGAGLLPLHASYSPDLNTLLKSPIAP